MRRQRTCGPGGNRPQAICPGTHRVAETGGWKLIVENSAIVAKGLGIRRGGRWILRPAFFGFAGGVIGIAGPPGAGKSALLATLATLRRPQAGTLEIFGREAGRSAELRPLRARIGFLPTDARWAGGSTV